MILFEYIFTLIIFILNKLKDYWWNIMTDLWHINVILLQILYLIINHIIVEYLYYFYSTLQNVNYAIFVVIIAIVP